MEDKPAVEHWPDENLQKMQNNHDGRESDHQDGGVQRAQAGDPALDASRPGNEHRDPGALNRERERNQKYRSTGLASKGHRLRSHAVANAWTSKVHFPLQTKVAAKKP